MSFFNIIVMGFGKMPADCANILLSENVPVQCIWETEENGLSPLQGLCTKFNIPFERPSRNKTTNLLDSLTEPTVVFSINNNYLFPPIILKKGNLRIINFHNALLPSYRGHGRIIPTWAILNGELQHGVTWHLVNTVGIDNGDILCQEEFVISGTDTALKVMMRAVSLGTDIFCRYWKEFISPHCVGRPQGPGQGRIYRSNDIPNDGWIDTSWDFEYIGRFLRSMDYGPFNLLPSPKVNVNCKNYLVRRYEIDEEDSFKSREILFEQCSDKSLTKANLLYEQGIIKLYLQRET